MSIEYLPAPRAMSYERLATMRADLEQLVTSEAGPRKRRWRRRNFLAGASVIAILAGGGGTAIAWSYLHPRAVTNTATARCYSDDIYTSGKDFHGSTVATPDSATSASRVEDALATCASLWRVGALQAGVATAVANRTQQTYAVPALVGCTLPDGVAAIFPGPADTCEQIGLAPQLPAAVRPPEPTGPGSSPGP